MKTNYLKLIPLLITSQITFGQSTNGTLANTYVAGRYLGWDASSGANPLLFTTNAVNRMALTGTNPAGSISGALGLGTNLFLPQSKLHVVDFGPAPASDAFGRMFRTDGLSLPENRWSLFTGTTPANSLERFRISTYAASSNSYLGTIQNGWLNVRTADVNRMKLNGNYTSAATQYTVNGYTFGQGVNTSGYLLLGQDLPLLSGGSTSSLYQNKGAFSLLHLNGEGTLVQELGYRPWMKTGITLTGNNDLSYFGLRKIGSAIDRTETTIVWSDNTSGIADEMVFRFIGVNVGGTAASNTLSPDFESSTDLDGLHVARFTPRGRFGLGNTFGHIDGSEPVGYNTPQSLLHMSYQFKPGNAYEPNGFLQITYRQPATGPVAIGMGENANDGLRLGIDNEIQNAFGVNFLNGFLRWQEQSSFIIQTDAENNGTTQDDERIRISSVGALVANYGPAYFGNIGVNNRTRIGISSNGAAPVARPLSLMHLGFDAVANSGWRNWMDIGSFTSNGTDHMYVGLKRISTATNDRFDAVINWGDNMIPSASTVGPDNLRFVFTSNSTGSAPASSLDGLEGARMTPSQTGVFTGFGGTPSTNPYFGGSENPTATLEVNGWGTTTAVLGGNSGLRFTNLTTASVPATNPGDGYLTVDAEGDVIYVNPPSNFAASCGSGVTSGFLSTNSRINLNNNNFYFANLASTSTIGRNKVAVGYDCAPILPARFSVLQKESSPIAINTISSYGENTDIGTIFGLEYVGVRGISQGVQTILRISNTGGSFTGKNAPMNYGVKGDASRGSFPGASMSFGGLFTSNDINSYGVRAQSSNPGTTGVSYGIFASSIGGGFNRAGYFDGQMETTGGALITSDSMFKTNVHKLNGSLKLIQVLKPVSYNMDAANYPQMNFDNHLQFGYIAQDVEQVFPNLVYDSYRPSNIDSLGNPIDSAVTYKSLNYNGLIPINTAAIIELNQKVEKATLSDQTIKTNVQDLTGSLDKVLEMRGVSYDWNHTVHPELNLDSANHVGFIAQEMQVIDPRLTYVADDSLLHVEYDKVVPILAEAIQELNDSLVARDSVITTQQLMIDSLALQNASQQATIDTMQNTITELNNRLSQLENCLSGILPYLCQLSHSAIQANTPEKQEEVRKNLNVTLSNRSAIVLDQNVPNPFAEQTVINFSIPETVKKAQIHFYDGNGRFMNSVEVIERGLGSVTVFGSDLSTGVYTYTLVADGQVVATKKMMKQ